VALSIAIEKARRTGASQENREAHKRAALRLEEVFKQSGMADELDRLDRPRNLKVESAFAVAFQAVDREAERDAVVTAFLSWQEDEKGERKDRHAAVNDLSAQMIRNNPVWIENEPVPDAWLNDGCGPSGRAA
jgi:hypothetical protein